MPNSAPEPELPPTPAPRLRRTWPQRLLIAFNLMVILGFTGSAAGLGYVYSKLGQLPRYDLDALANDHTSAGDAQNYLIVGVDSAEGLDEDDPIVRVGRARIGGLRGDTIMILRVDPEAEKASLLSLPRDLWVPIAGTGGNQKINAAINGGPERLIETIQDYFSIPIHHYVQVDFAGFIKLVDAVGGVPVPFNGPARDLHSGFNAPNGGCVTLKGDQALFYVRSRYFQSYHHGRWHSDPSADLGRISRQQDFIRHALDRAFSAGIRNPSKLDSVIDAALAAVTVDTELQGDDIFSLGKQFKSFDPSHLEMFRVPVVQGRAGGASVVRMIDADAEPILDQFRGLDRDDVTPEGVRVRVLNGSGALNEATTVSGLLAAVGFGTSSPGDYERSGLPATEIHYPAGNQKAADLVARYLTAGATLVEDDTVEGGDVEVVTGLDFSGVLDEPAPATATTSTTSTTTPHLTTSTLPPSTSSPTTSTTQVGIVPSDLDNGAAC